MLPRKLQGIDTVISLGNDLITMLRCLLMVRSDDKVLLLLAGQPGSEGAA